VIPKQGECYWVNWADFTYHSDDGPFLAMFNEPGEYAWTIMGDERSCREQELVSIAHVPRPSA